MNCGNITSRSNRLVKELRELQTKRKVRYENRSFVCDGIKLLGEAIQSGVKIKYIFAQEGIELNAEWLDEYDVYTAPRELMEYISTLECTQGVIFCCEMPESSDLEGEQILILDHLQDTGNLGTIIRCADAFGISTVVLDGTADPYNPKTVRAAMGALFRVKLCSMDSLHAIDLLKDKNIPTYAATLTESAVDITGVSLKRAAVVIGNEGNGVSGRVEDACSGHVILPMSGDAESLNASIAAGIIMWEMQKAR
ncbi:MAG: RNA methyltransferase [Clostridia bacterium]|nr:RNA methyltransferase [Clostridia bacterium]